MHPQAMQIDTDDLPRKMPAAGYVYLDISLLGSLPRSRRGRRRYELRSEASGSSPRIFRRMCLNSGRARRCVDAYTFRKGYTKPFTRGMPTASGGGECTQSDPCRAVPCRICEELAPRRRAPRSSRRSKMLLRLSLQQSFQAECDVPVLTCGGCSLDRRDFREDTRPAYGSIVAPAHAPLRHRSPLSTAARPSRWRPNGGAADA